MNKPNRLETLIDTLADKFKNRPLTDKEHADNVLHNKTEKENIIMTPSNPAMPEMERTPQQVPDSIDILKVVKAFKITPDNLQATRIQYLKDLEVFSLKIVDLKESIQTLDDIATKMRSKMIMP